MPKPRVKASFERYDISRSPLAQRPTQRRVAELVGETKGDLTRLRRESYKEQFIRRRKVQIGKKVRELAFPVGRLRTVHERLKDLLNRIKQPEYLFSPRRGRSQRDNAALHLDQDQYLSLDLKQFYPSTTSEMVYRWFVDELNSFHDVAALLRDLCTIDGKVSFGSPLTPVL